MNGVQLISHKYVTHSKVTQLNENNAYSYITQTNLGEMNWHITQFNPSNFKVAPFNLFEHFSTSLIYELKEGQTIKNMFCKSSDLI